jgi:ABC-2 type transport system permease protein
MRLKASIIKEFLVLLRDIPGLIVLFIMPVAMIIVISLVQDTTIQSLKGTKINILYTDYDQDILGETLRTGLEKIRTIQYYGYLIGYVHIKADCC